MRDTLSVQRTIQTFNNLHERTVFTLSYSPKMTSVK